MTHKQCTKCGETKPLEEFHRKHTAADGRRSACKSCINAYYKENKDKILSQQKEYVEENKVVVTQRKKVYYKKAKLKSKFK